MIFMKELEELEELEKLKEIKELEELKPIVSTMKTSTKVWANERSEVITTLTTNK